MQFDSNLITIALACVAGIAWLVRLEYKANTTADDVKEMSDDVYKHHADKSIHADDSELNRRFEALGTEMHEMKGDLKQGFKDINSRFDNLLIKQ